MKLVKVIGDEPVTLAEMKSYLRIDLADDDNLINALIMAARSVAEGHTNRAIIRQELAQVIEGAGREIEIPRPPLVSVTVTGGNVERTDIISEPGKVVLTERPTGPVTVEFVAGYDSANIPPRIKQAIMLTVAHWYDNRGLVGAPGTMPQELPFAAAALLDMDRIGGV